MKSKLCQSAAQELFVFKSSTSPSSVKHFRALVSYTEIFFQAVTKLSSICMGMINITTKLNPRRINCCSGNLFCYIQTHPAIHPRNGKCFYVMLFEPAHEVMVLIPYATSEVSDKPAHPRSLARAFAVRTHQVWK